MAQVSVTIAGRLYRMACGEGEEEHLQGLGRRLDAKIAELRGSFGEIGDQRITVMAALTMADQLAEAERRIAALEAEIERTNEAHATSASATRARREEVAAVVEEAAAHIDRVAQALAAGPTRERRD